MEGLIQVITTAVVGPDTLFREGLKRVFRPPYLAEAAIEAIDFVENKLSFNLVVLVAMTDQTALLTQVRRAKEFHASTRVVVIGNDDRAEAIWPILVAGADGYLLSGISPEALHASLNAVMLGATVILPAFRNAVARDRTASASEAERVTEVVSREAGHNYLSTRETEILLCLTSGASNKHIARKCGITEATVKVHLKAILRKIRASNRTQAAMWAQANAASLRSVPRRLKL